MSFGDFCRKYEAEGMMEGDLSLNVYMFMYVDPFHTPSLGQYEMASDYVSCFSKSYIEAGDCTVSRCNHIITKYFLTSLA